MLSGVINQKDFGFFLEWRDTGVLSPVLSMRVCMRVQEVFMISK